MSTQANTEKQFEEFAAENIEMKAQKQAFAANKELVNKQIESLTEYIKGLKETGEQLDIIINKLEVQEAQKVEDESKPVAPPVPAVDQNMDLRRDQAEPGEKPQRGTSPLADEVTRRSEEILSGRRPNSLRSALLDPFKFDQNFFDQQMASREDRIRDALRQGKISTVMGISFERIRDNRGLAGVPDSINDYLMTKMSGWSLGKSASTQAFVAEMDLRRRFNKRKDKKGGGLLGTAVTVLIKNITNKIAKTVDRVVDGVKDATLGRAARSKLGKQVINTATSIKQKKVDSKFGQTVEKISTTVGKVADVVDDFRGSVGQIGKGLGKGALIGAVAAVAFGGSPVVGIVLGTTSSIAAIGSNLLEGRLFKNKALRRLQGRLNIDPRFLENGVLDYDKMLRISDRHGLGGIKVFFQKPGQFFSIANSAFGWGSAGSAIGGLVGLLVGGPGAMALGASLGMGAGAAAGVGWNRFIFNAKIAQTSKLIRAIKFIPSFDIMGRIQTNLWFGSQLDIIIKKYKGDVGRYLSDNFLGNSQRTVFENMLNLSTNWLNLGMGIYSIGTTAGTRALFTGMATLLGKTLQLSAKFIRGFNAASIAGSVVGTAITYAVLSALGLSIGPAAMIGMTVGGLIGTTIGVAVSFVATPVIGFLTSFLANAILIPIGGWIGALIDKATGKLVNYTSIIFNTFSAIMNLLALIKGKFDADNLIMVIISLLGLFQAFDKMGTFETAYQCVNAASCPNVNANPGYGMTPELNFLENYNLGIINNKDLSEIQRENLYAYLDEYSDEITQKFPDKKVYLNLLDDTSFETTDMVILGLNSNHTVSIDEIATQISNQLESWSTDKTIISQFN